MIADFNMKIHIKTLARMMFAAVVLFISPAPSRAQDLPAAGGQTQEAKDLEIDKEHMRKIYDAIQAYKKKSGDLPAWLSDLYPEFLSDPAVLMSPVELRTGRSALWSFKEPKMKTSYIYEFSDGDSGTPGENGKHYTFKEKKMIQMEEYGPVVPILRCHLYGRVLNLCYSGDIYQSETFWENDPATRVLMAKLGPGPGPRDAMKMRLTVRAAANNQPVPGADVQTSKLMAMSLLLPPRDLKTDAGGQCEINLAAKNPKALALRIAAAGYITMQTEWTHGEVPSEWTANLQKGTPIGGVVRDPAGKPIGGVTIALSTIQHNADGGFVEIDLGAVTTDEAGKWTNFNLPPDFKSITLDLSQSEFRPVQYNLAASQTAGPEEVSKASLLAVEAALVMKPAFAIAGVVADAAGKPIAGAKVSFQQWAEAPNNRATNTDVAGRFKFSILTAGEGTVSVAADGFLAQTNTVSFDDNSKPLAFKLTVK